MTNEVVEYFSATQNKYIPAKVLKVNANGTYNLDCKPEVPADKIRKVQGAVPQAVAGGAAQFREGDAVEYFSATQNKYIPAKVMRVNPNGTYNLDCKPEVPPDKIRRTAGGAPAQSYTAPLGSFSNGAAPLSSYNAPQGAGTMPRGTTGAHSNFDAPVQLLSVSKRGNRWHYEVCAQGAAMLEKFGGRRIAVASVCGLYRTGKSYLLNLLLERVQKGQPLFQVGSTTRPCTEGLWLWGSVEADDEHSPLLAFLDCEGFGSTDSDRQRDAQLMTLCSLLSSVLVLNTKGVLNESLFNALALTCRFAEHIEERGNEASRPVLLWVLRDFMLELRDAQGRPTTPDEYLDQALHAAPSVSGDDKGGAREVRTSLLRFFSHRSCATLVRPAVEESQLQNLERVPFQQLRPEFRAGVQALRTQLVATCHSNAKTIGGSPLGCFAFVALMRQLVDSLNDNKVLSVKGAWETVQHTACGGLADELRQTACETLRSLATGKSISGGAQLPMAEDALWTVLRDQRHKLKSEWQERAVGEESVRVEYWQELKESIAREEHVVKQQNTRLADQKLLDALRTWQEWLDDDGGSWSQGEGICTDLQKLMERMPAAPISRASRSAIEAAGRRVVAARLALASTVEQTKLEKDQAMNWGQEAAQKEGVARTELQARLHHLEQMEARLKETEDARQTTNAELQQRHEELERSKAQYQEQLKANEASYEMSRSDLQERHNQLQIQFADMQDGRDRCQLEANQSQHLLSAAQMKLDAREAELAEAKVQMQQYLNEIGAAQKREHELKSQNRMQAEKEISLRASLDDARAVAAKADAERLASERCAKGALDIEHSEKRRLAAELEQSRVEVEGLSKQLTLERETLKIESEQTRAEHMKLVEESRKKLEAERKVYQDSLQQEKGRLLDKERNAGELEGQVQAVTSEVQTLREQSAFLQTQLQNSERTKDQYLSEANQLRQDLNDATMDSESKLKQLENDYDLKLKDAESRADQKKCCTLM